MMEDGPIELSPVMGDEHNDDYCDLPPNNFTALFTPTNCKPRLKRQCVGAEGNQDVFYCSLVAWSSDVVEELNSH